MSTLETSIQAFSKWTMHIEEQLIPLVAQCEGGEAEYFLKHAAMEGPPNFMCATIGIGFHNNKFFYKGSKNEERLRPPVRSLYNWDTSI